MTIGERIKGLRTEANLTQEELGEKLGVKKAAIQKYENGGIVNLKVQTIKQLSEVFSVPPSYIMGWDKFDETYSTNLLKLEVKLIEEIQARFGYIGVDLYHKLISMNEDGLRKVLFYVEDIFDKYKRSEEH